jgi:hypothetical protein
LAPLLSLLVGSVFRQCSRFGTHLQQGNELEWIHTT